MDKIVAMSLREKECLGKKVQVREVGEQEMLKK
jgi:hypothetical protein